MAKLTQARVINYGLDPAADIWADDVVGEGVRIRNSFQHCITRKRYFNYGYLSLASILFIPPSRGSSSRPGRGDEPRGEI